MPDGPVASDHALGAVGTAQAVAAMRAFHQLADGEPKILADPITMRLLDPGVREAIERTPERFQSAGMRGLRSHVLLRSRYTEDELKAAVGRGVRQYVILGAGLDTFAWRQPAWAAGVHIFEVDHPAAQRSKRDRIARAGLELPPNLRFVAVDFERDVLVAELEANGFERRQPAVVALLGVMVYLSADAADAALRFVATLPPGTVLVLTFSPPVDVQDESDRSAAHAETAAALGEPWRTRISRQELEAKLRGLGFKEVDFLSPEEATRRYFSGRTDGLPSPRRVRIVRANH